MRAALLGLVCGLGFGAFASTAAAAAVSCPQEYGVFAHPHDGKKYVECQKGMPIEHACSAGLLWDDLRKSCASAKAMRHKPPKKPTPRKKKR